MACYSLLPLLRLSRFCNSSAPLSQTQTATVRSPASIEPQSLVGTKKTSTMKLLCLLFILAAGFTSVSATDTVPPLVAGLASLRVSAQLQGAAQSFDAPPQVQMIFDRDLRNSLSESNFSSSVSVPQDALLLSVVFEVEFLTLDSTLNIALSSPDLPIDAMTMLVLGGMVQHTDPVAPSVRHTYTMPLMLLTMVMSSVHPSSEVTTFRLQFALSVATNVDPSIHREYGVGVTALMQPPFMFKPTRVLGLDSAASAQARISFSSNSSLSSWANITASNHTAPLLMIARDALLLSDPNRFQSTDTGVSVWQQTQDVFMSNTVSNPVSRVNNSAILQLSLNVSIQLRVPYPSLWLPLLPMQAEMSSAAAQILKVSASAARCVSDVGDDANNAMQIAIPSTSLQWDAQAIAANMALDAIAGTNSTVSDFDAMPTSVLLQTASLPLEIQYSIPPGYDNVVFARCVSFTFNLTNATHTQVYRMDWRAQTHIANLRSVVATTTGTTGSQGSSGGGTAVAVTSMSSSGSSNVTASTVSDSNNGSDGGSVALGVLSGLAVFALVGYRVWLDYKDRVGAGGNQPNNIQSAQNAV